MINENFELTTSGTARAADMSEECIRLYADLGLIAHKKLPNGMRLFPLSSATRAREVKAERLAGRTRKRASA